MPPPFTTKSQVAQHNRPAPSSEAPAGQLMDMSMAETGEEAGPYWAQLPSVMVPRCDPATGDHWHVMTKVAAVGFADRAMRSPVLLSWDDVMQYLEEQTEDGGDAPWVEEHVYDPVR